MRWTHQWREKRGVANPKVSVVGAEACLWAELVDEEVFDVRLYSRLPVLAERFWSAASVNDLNSMYERLVSIHEVLVAINIVDMKQRVRSQLSDLGLNETQIDMMEMIEPVKWYARLLGQQALNARIEGREMPQARPYDTSSALNRAADFLPPESLAARPLTALIESAFQGDTHALEDITDLCGDWQGQSNHPWPEELRAIVTSLNTALATVVDYCKQEIDARTAREHFAAVAQPQGEYVLGLPVQNWLEGV
jgi:hypothetical protein